VAPAPEKLDSYSFTEGAEYQSVFVVTQSHILKRELPGVFYCRILLVIPPKQLYQFVQLSLSSLDQTSEVFPPLRVNTPRTATPQVLQDSDSRDQIVLTVLDVLGHPCMAPFRSQSEKVSAKERALKSSLVSTLSAARPCLSNTRVSPLAGSARSKPFVFTEKKLHRAAGTTLDRGSSTRWAALADRLGERAFHTVIALRLPKRSEPHRSRYSGQQSGG
jgi:hypothetical protein